MIAIVGAGITGLALAHELRKRSVPHVVLEASDRVGGVIRSARIDGHLLEWGPQRGRLTQSLRSLIHELGIEDELITAPPGLPLLVYRNGKLREVPYSPGDFLRTDLLTIRGKLRLLLEPFTAGPRQGEAVASYFTRKMGREAYENLLGPLYGGLYASDPADMTVDLSLGRVLQEFGVSRSLLLPLLRRGGTIVPPPACSFRDGLATLPRALYEVNRENVRCGTPVTSITRIGDGFQVAWEGGLLQAERVVVTTPAPVTARILREIAPDAADSVSRLKYNPLAVVHLHARTELRALGYQVAFGEALYTRGVTFNDSLFSREGVYTAYLGGARAPEVVERPDEEVREIAEQEFEQVTGASATAISIEREQMPAWDRSWRALVGMEWPAGVHIAANWESRPGMPGRLAQANRLATLLERPGG